MRNLPFLTASLAALILSGCAGTVTPDTQAKIDTYAPIVCAGFEAADTIFNAAHPSADKVALEAKAYAGVHEACKPPYTLDAATLIKKATDATIAIQALMK